MRAVNSYRSMKGVVSMFIVDRFEGDWAVVEYGGITFNLPSSLFATNVKEGDVITINISIDQALTNERRQKAKEMMQSLFDS